MSFTELAEVAVKVAEPAAKKLPAHPKVSVMVSSAITSLGAKKGSSLQAINKFISANYNVDTQKLAHHIKKYIKTAVESGELVQPTGKGASGSFKISKPKPAAKPKVPKVKTSKLLKVQTSTPKKTLKPKKVFAPNKSPVRSVKSGDDEVAPVDATFTAPNAKVSKKPKVAVPTKSRKSRVSLPIKVKKSKKLLEKKVTLPNVSLKEEPGSLSNFVKPKGTPRPKGKKLAKAGEPAASVANKAASKKTSARAKQK